MKLAAVVIVSSLALAGCAGVREAKVSESFQMNYDEVVPVRETSPDGAIYSRANAGFFLGDRRAQRVGDLLTVNINENLTASKTDETKLNRDGTLSATLPSALFGPGAINVSPARTGALSTNISSSFDGKANAQKNDSINFDITVVVTRVYENGNLWVQGQKQLSINQNEEFVRVSGLIRPEDIQPGNKITGDKLAQAQISYTGAGDFHETTNQGWLSRVFNVVSPI